MDDPQEQSADRLEQAQVWDIPDTSAEFGRQVRVDRWNRQAWPPLTFGVPEGWSDVPADQFAFLPAERRIPRMRLCCRTRGSSRRSSVRPIGGSRGTFS
jgi:hypothetical protein